MIPPIWLEHKHFIKVINCLKTTHYESTRKPSSPVDKVIKQQQQNVDQIQMKRTR